MLRLQWPKGLVRSIATIPFIEIPSSYTENFAPPWKSLRKMKPGLMLVAPCSPGTSMDSGATADLLLTIGSVLERNRLQPLAEDLYKTAIKIKKASHKEDSAEAAVAHSALGRFSQSSSFSILLLLLCHGRFTAHVRRCPQVCAYLDRSR